jgi:hypothetical protein
MRRTFVESSNFTATLKKLGVTDLLLRIQKAILDNPEVGDVVKDSGGVRKFRVAKDGSGKSGGFRVFYLDLPVLKITHLLVLLDKRDKENISSADKNEMKVQSKKLKERR